ncbi:hypothetical protein [Rhodoblastus sp.]
MRRLFFVGMLLAMSGCAHRSVSFFYYPGLDRSADHEAHLLQLAEKECGKYGMVVDSLQWRKWTQDDQEELTYICRLPRPQ